MGGFGERLVDFRHDIRRIIEMPGRGSADLGKNRRSRDGGGRECLRRDKISQLLQQKFKRKSLKRKNKRRNEKINYYFSLSKNYEIHIF